MQPVWSMDASYVEAPTSAAPTPAGQARTPFTWTRQSFARRWNTSRMGRLSTNKRMPTCSAHLFIENRRLAVPHETTPAEGFPKYMPQLDALRGVAVLSVLLYHFIPRYFENSPLGWIGVRLFFVLSGFLITG